MPYVVINLKNLDMLYTNEKKIVLFTMTDCPFCNNLIKKEWKLIKNKYKSNTKIKIFEIERNLLNLVKDNIKNQISGFPTIAILKGNKLIKTFSKERTLFHLEEFILSIQPKK